MYFKKKCKNIQKNQLKSCLYQKKVVPLQRKTKNTTYDF